MGIEEFLLERATKEGIDIGVEKGIEIEERRSELKMIEIILSLADDGFDIERIAKITKLSIDQVSSILKNNKKDN